MSNWLQPLTGHPDATRGDQIAAIASHNSYHLAQVVFLRRMLGAWPPPSGGDTW